MPRELCEEVNAKRVMRKSHKEKFICEEVYDLRRHDLSSRNMRRSILDQKQADFSSFCLSPSLFLSQHIHLVRRTMTKVALSRLLFENSVGFSYSELGF